MTRTYNPAVADAQSLDRPRVAQLSFFFPAHNEAANINGLVEEALDVLPTLADEFEIIAVDDGSRDATPRLADDLAATHPSVRAVHHAVNLGYGAALRSGFRAARYDLVCFLDGDRQFKVADIGLLLDRYAGAEQPDAVLGYRLKRADPFVRLAYARGYRLALRIFFGLRVRDPDCACKLFRRSALEGVSVESGGAFFSAELLIKLALRDRRLAEVGVPHYPRVAGSASGANPKVVLRAVRDFWLLRLRLWANRRAALRRGEPVARRDGRGLVQPALVARLVGQIELQRVDELAEDRQFLVVGSLGHHTGTVKDGIGREDGHACAHRKGYRVARARIEIDLATVDLEQQASAERVVGEVADDDLLDRHARARRESARTGRGSSGAPERRPAGASRWRWPPMARSRWAGSGRGPCRAG